MHIVPFHQLSTADLHIDRIYQGKRHGNAGDDPLHQLLGVSNQGGFRILGSREHPRLVVLTTSMSDPEWPDDLDNETGGFTYYGDNKRPGRGLHETPRFGNSLLRDMFDAMHTQRREHVPPVLIFSSTGQYRDMIFKGLAVPGRVGIPTPDDLVAIWKITGGESSRITKRNLQSLTFHACPGNGLMHCGPTATCLKMPLQVGGNGRRRGVPGR